MCIIHCRLSFVTTSSASFIIELLCAPTSAALRLLYSTWLLGSSSIASEKNLIASS